MTFRGRLFSVFLLCAVLCKQVDLAPSPVVIIPGDGGNQLEAKLTDRQVSHIYCSRNSDWYRLWLSVTSFVEPLLFCWIDNISLIYNKTTSLFQNQQGVETRTVNFGDTSSIQYLDPDLPNETIYFDKLVQYPIQDLGLITNKTLRAAPYDFRFTPNHLLDYKSRLQLLIEETYLFSGKQKVTLISHSMGGLVSLWFLTLQDQSWVRHI